MKLIDLHADTITALYYKAGNCVAESEFINELPKSKLASNEHQVDINKLKLASSMAQFFVLWLNLEKCKKYKISAWDQFIKLHRLLISELNKSPNSIALASDFKSLQQNNHAHKMNAFVAVEEGAFIEKLDDLDVAYSMNVRYITLVWNYETHIGVPSCVDQTRGLTKFGFDMVTKMQDLGILVDISHLSDQGAFDVLSIARKPIIASHSNARSICNHTRNLPDLLIREIANNGGVIGVGCVPNFLDEINKTIKIDTMIRHIQHIHNIAGIDSIALGNDFDGYKCYSPDLDEIKNIGDMPKLADKLLLAGFKTAEIEKIFNQNALRIIKTI